MKVCMLIEWLPPLFSGAARQALQLAPHLKAHGVDVFFVGSLVDPQSPREDTLNGFRVYRVPFSTGIKPKRLIGLVELCRLLASRRHDFDVLHLHGAYHVTLGAAWFAQTVLRKKVVIKMTSINLDTPGAVKTRSYGAISWFLYRQATAFVCMSTAQYGNCIEHGLPSERVHKIPNGVDTERFRPAASEAERREIQTRLGLSPDFQYGVFIGTIEKDKGVELLVDAAEAVCAARRDVKFLLIGPDGRNPSEHNVRPEFVAQLRGKISAAGLEDRVLLLGHKQNAEEFLRAATFFVFPSRSEGFGTVLIEAMASGLPCVAQKITGVTADIIASGHDGIVIDEENSAAFADAILLFLGDPSATETLSKAARQTTLERFDLPTIARCYVELYKGIA
jgi:glycosyltransferase involved in cell wall biosynthesis